jgi:hypothetical protein
MFVRDIALRCSLEVWFAATSVIHTKLTHYPTLAEVAGYAEGS